MPGVPCVRPSHGSVQNAANGMQPQSRRASAAACTSSPTSQWPVCSPSAIGDPSGARTPPCVLRIMNAGRVVSSGAPAHGHVVGESEQVAARLLAQHLGGDRQRPFRCRTHGAQPFGAAELGEAENLVAGGDPQGRLAIRTARVAAGSRGAWAYGVNAGIGVAHRRPPKGWRGLGPCRGRFAAPASGAPMPALDAAACCTPIGNKPSRAAEPLPPAPAHVASVSVRRIVCRPGTATAGRRPPSGQGGVTSGVTRGVHRSMDLLQVGRRRRPHAFGQCSVAADRLRGRAARSRPRGVSGPGWSGCRSLGW